MSLDLYLGASAAELAELSAELERLGLSHREPAGVALEVWSVKRLTVPLADAAEGCVTEVLELYNALDVVFVPGLAVAVTPPAFNPDVRSFVRLESLLADLFSLPDFPADDPRCWSLQVYRHAAQRAVALGCALFQC